MKIKKSAQKAINNASIAATIAAFVPIPFADSAILLPIQASMITGIYKSYDKKITDGVVNGVLTSMSAATLGKGVAGGIFKLVPGVGTVAGGVISSGIAVSITQAMGYAVAKGLENNEIENTSDLIAIMTTAFQFATKKRR